ncbi:hypothetical protein [Kosakonia sp. YIM B13611]|uniref:hypothetical protein n=1 Tax=unclassified Kosakonia TaxID=2632876 RepID=UPI00367480AB
MGDINLYLGHSVYLRLMGRTLQNTVVELHHAGFDCHLLCRDDADNHTSDHDRLPVQNADMDRSGFVYGHQYLSRVASALVNSHPARTGGWQDCHFIDAYVMLEHAGFKI